MQKRDKRQIVGLNVWCIILLFCFLLSVTCFFIQLNMSSKTMDKEVLADFAQYEELFIDFFNQRKSGKLPAHTIATIQGLAEINGYESKIVRLTSKHSMLAIYNDEYYECLIMQIDIPTHKHSGTLIIDVRPEYFDIPIFLMFEAILSAILFKVFYKKLIKSNKLKGREVNEL